MGRFRVEFVGVFFFSEMDDLSEIRPFSYTDSAQISFLSRICLSVPS